MDFQAKLRYRPDIPNESALRDIDVARAECFMDDVRFLPVDIRSVNISIKSIHIEAVTRTRYDAIVDYSIQYENTEILDDFELWLMRKRAPDDTSDLPVTLHRIPVQQRNGRLVQAIDVENQGNVTLYFQVTRI